jgi:capsid protein
LGLRSWSKKREWQKARSKVDSAVTVFSTLGLGYSVTSGIVGDKSGLNTKQLKQLNRAAQTMGALKAGYYKDSVKKNATDLKAKRYAPMKFKSYAKMQSKTFKQLYSSSHLRAAVTCITRTLYNTRIQSVIDRYELGLTPEESQEWVKKTERKWRIDTELKDWDEYFENNYAQQADVCKNSYIGIGEFFAILRLYGKTSGRNTNVSVQVISPFQVMTPFATTITDGNYIDQGIEFDRLGQKVAIHICPGRQGEEWNRITIYNENGFKQVLHGFIQKEPGQIRGIPDAAKSWHEFMSIADMLKFEMDSAKINATIAVSISADSNTTPSSRANLNDLQQTLKSGGASFGGDATDEVSSSSAEVNYDIREVTQGGFVVQNFPPGYKVDSHDTKRPNVSIPEFIEKDLEYIYTANFGLSVVLVKQRFDNAYNASKGAIDLSWKQGIEYYLRQFESDFDRPIWNAWLSAKVATGKITVLDWGNPEKRTAWSGMQVMVPSKPSLNPFQEAKASSLRSSDGTSNRDFESISYNGNTASENAERLLIENKELADAQVETEQD